MATYTVQVNDTPQIIARKTGVPAGAIIAANPQKRKQIVDGAPTFLTLQAGERLNVPRVSGLGEGGADLRGLGRAQGLGDPVSDGTLAALISLSQSNPTLFATPNLTVLAFQKSAGVGAGVAGSSSDGEYGTATAAAAQALDSGAPAAIAAGGFSAENATDLANWLTAMNADATAGTLCTPPGNNDVMAFQVTYNKVTNSTLIADGQYGDAVAQAAQALAGTTVQGVAMPATAPAVCANYSNGGGTPPPPPPPPNPNPAPAPGGTTTTSSGASTAVVVGLVALAAAGTFVYLKKAKHGAGAPLLGGHARARRLPAHAVRRLAR
jgi:hypothetical protein